MGQTVRLWASLGLAVSHPWEGCDFSIPRGWRIRILPLNSIILWKTAESATKLSQNCFLFWNHNTQINEFSSQWYSQKHQDGKQSYLDENEGVMSRGGEVIGENQAQVWAKSLSLSPLLKINNPSRSNLKMFWILKITSVKKLTKPQFNS